MNRSVTLFISFLLICATGCKEAVIMPHSSVLKTDIAGIMGVTPEYPALVYAKLPGNAGYIICSDSPEVVRVLDRRILQVAFPTGWWRANADR